MPKQNDDPNMHKKTRAIGNMHAFITYQIDVVNKQLASPLSQNAKLSNILGRNNSFSETSLNEP